MGPRSPDQVHPLRRGRRRRISIPNGLVRMANEKVVVVESEDDEVEIVQEKGKEDAGDVEKVDAMAVPSTTTTEEQKTFDQSQSLLFQKLPPEIRSLIWRECVGNYNIYLGVVDGEKRVRHCKIFAGKGLMGIESDQYEQNQIMAKNYFMPMLQSCRRM
jgi:hypothetical protein